MAFCPKCGNEIKQDDKFCAGCGSSILERRPSAGDTVAGTLRQPVVSVSKPPPPPTYTAYQSTVPPIPSRIGEPVPVGFWLLPIFFGAIGGIMAWAMVKDQNPAMARAMLIIGILPLVILGLMMCVLYATGSSAHSYSFVLPESKVLFASLGIFV